MDYRRQAEVGTLNVIVLFLLKKNLIYNPFERKPPPALNNKLSYVEIDIVGQYFQNLVSAFVSVPSFYQSSMVPVEDETPTSSLIYDWEILFTPKDSRVFHTRMNSTTTSKDLFNMFVDFDQGVAKLVPAASNLWGRYVKRDTFGNMCLTHIQISMGSIPTEHAVLCFQCDWPSQASEFISRERPHRWPKDRVIQDIVENTCRLVPVILPDTAESDLYWKFSFAISENLLTQKAVTNSQRSAFHVFFVFIMKYLKETVDGVRYHHLTTIFFYACENLPKEVWTNAPMNCIMSMVQSLVKQLRERNIPDYFMKGRNLIHDVEPSVIDRQRCQLEEFIRQTYISVYFILDESQLISSTQCGKMIDISLPSIIDAQPEEVTFNLKKRDSLIMRTFDSTVRSLYLAEALNVCLSFYEKSSEKEEYQKKDSLSFPLFMQELIQNLPFAYRWCFSLYIDRQLGTDLMKRIVTGHDIVPISAYVGNHIHEDFGVRSDSLCIPCSVVENAHELVAFVDVFTKCLHYCFGLEDAMMESLHFFILEHAEHVLVRAESSELPASEGDATKTISTSQKLWIFFAHLARRCMLKNESFRMVELMDIYENVCDRLQRPESYACLSLLWGDLGNREKQMRAMFKMQKLQSQNRILKKPPLSW